MRMKKLVLTLAMLAGVLATPARAEQFTVRGEEVTGGVLSIPITSRLEAGDHSSAIEVYPGMRLTFVQGGTAQVLVYAVGEQDNDFAEITGGTLLRTMLTSDSFTVSTNELFIRLVIVSAEAAATPSLIRVFYGAALGSTGSGGSTPQLACASGSVKGGGYDERTGWYEWTCGNYPWSAEIGGVDGNSVSAYNTPTTLGGNSWVMTCSAPGVGSPGTATEQAACLAAGEQIHMYATADLILAHDQVRPFGTVYLPEGIYHQAYCGKSETGVPNGCPVAREDNGKQLRKLTITRGRKIVGAGEDLDGPFTNGRTGTWLLSDQGSDNDGDGQWTDDNPDWLAVTGGPTASPYLGGHWQWHGGSKDTREVCGRTAGSTGCLTNTTTSGWSTEGSIGMSPINAGYTAGALAADVTAYNYASGAVFPELCLHDTIGSPGSGVCTGDTRVQCTNNGGVRTGANAGDCASLGLGTCVGLYTATQTLADTLEADDYMTVRLSIFGTGGYGEADGFNGTSQSFFVPIARDGFEGTLCGAGNVGKIVRVGGPTTEAFKYGITNAMALSAANSSMTAYGVPASRLRMDGGGMSHLSTMPKDYYGSATCADGTQAGCDELEAINLSGGFRVKHHHLASWFNSGNAGNHYGFSVVDGDPACVDCEFSDSLVSDYHGLASDASGWLFADNVWQNGRTTSGGSVRAVIATAFGPESRFYRQSFRNIWTDAIYAFQNSTGAIIRDTRVESVEFAVAMMRLRGAINLTVDGITGQGNSGQLISAEGGTVSTQTPSNIHFSNIHLRNHHWTEGTRARALLYHGSYGGTASFDGRYYGTFSLRNSSLQVHGDDSQCLIFFDGMRGLDTSPDEGQGFNADDDRNVFDFENIDMEVYDDGSPTGTQQALCFGDHANATGYLPGQANVYNVGQVVGALPSWRNISVGGVRIPDNPFASMTSEQAGDCGSHVYGMTVRVHDSDTAGVCEDSDNDGVMDPESADDVGLTAVCVCDPTGNAGTGLWSPL